jgi:hypothetical protein
MLSPLPRHGDWRHGFAHPSSRISLPRYGCQVGPCIVLFEACSVFTHVTACTRALSPYFVTRFTEGFNHFVTSIVAPVASGWSGCRVGLAPTGKAPPLHGARQKQILANTSSQSSGAQMRLSEVIHDSVSGPMYSFATPRGRYAHPQACQGRRNEQRETRRILHRRQLL